MKKILLVMMALLTMTTAMAQPSDRKAPKKMTHQEMTTQMTSKLKLNDAQKAKVAALNKEYQDILMPPEPPKNADGSRPEPPKNGDKAMPKKPDSKHMAKRQEYEKKLKQILTDEQYKSYQKMQPPHGKRPEMKDNK
jgi:Spy/CpxP family protein refolding chaperone